MKNWITYIARQKPEYMHTPLPAERKAGLVVVIPCYDEPSLQATLHSLREADRPAESVLTVIVVNSGEFSDEHAVRQNRKTYEEILLFAKQYNEPHFGFFPLFFESLPRKHAGVGLARKIGMDLAVDHFLQNEQQQGVIVSLDADCTVSPNFLTGICNAFAANRRPNATIHGFRHRVEESADFQESAARQYEAYIRYFSAMLASTGFPYYYHTIGSAFAVSADAYVRVGGMGRQQGGEDFYFLQKVFALEHIVELADVQVFPMARLSDRVPFGTGPALQRITSEPGGNERAYSLSSFQVLKELFLQKDAYFGKDSTVIEQMTQKLHPSLQQYLQDIDFLSLVDDCNRNSASQTTFGKRFFHHFNAFKIIKFLNQVHPHPFPFESYAGLIDEY